MFTKGNKFWTYREWKGRKNKFTPEELWDQAVSYFEWAKKNPIKEKQLFNGRMGVSSATKKYPRPFTIQGLCNYIGIVVTTFDNYGKYSSKENDKNYNALASDYLEVVTCVRQIIYDQKYSGAAVGLFNSAIMVRDLSLVNQEQSTITVEQPLFPNAFPDERDD